MDARSKLRAILTATIALGAAAAHGQPPVQTQAPIMAPLEVTAGSAPIPEVGEGAPVYTAEELKAVGEEARRDSFEAGANSRRCNPNPSRLATMADLRKRYSLYRLYLEEGDAQRALMTAAARATSATEASVDARRAAARGEANQDQLKSAELARQAAVNAYVAARTAVLEAEAKIRDRQELYYRRTPEEAVNGEMIRLADERLVDGGVDAVATGRNEAQLTLAGVGAVERDSGAPAAFMISGRVQNPSGRAVAMPALSFTAVDQFGRALETKIADPGGRQRIPPGGSLPFAYEFKPKPGAAKTVLITIGREKPDQPSLAVGMYCDGVSFR